MQHTIFDIETDGLLDKVTKIHCLSYRVFQDGKEISRGSHTNYNKIKDFIISQKTLVGHNIIRYDIPVLEKILGIKVKARLIDTLALSWYLYPTRIRHGLEQWGDELGVQKPIITDWENLSTKEYVHRCQRDVKINTLLFFKQLAYLNLLYEADINQVNGIINYLSFKLDCAAEQEEVKCKLDRDLIVESLEELHSLREEKTEVLVAAMPKQIKYKEVTKPLKMFKADGELSKRGENWLELLYECNLDEDHEETILVKVSEEPGNTSSTSQVKDWLYSLGWKPREFEFRKNTKGDINKVPQIYIDSEVCDSIKELYDIEPALESLDMLSLINHRIGIFEAFLKLLDDEDFTKAEVSGLTNTLRFKHRKPIVNLPQTSKFYGEQIRGSIIRPTEDHLLCGSDMSSLEDTTKQHYMYFFDPEYVKQMRVPGFDPHVDIGILANIISKEEEEFLHWYKKVKKNIESGDTSISLTKEDHEKAFEINEKRSIAKTVNFAGIYGAGPPKIAQSTGMSLRQAQILHKTYWERNKAVKQVASTCKVKTVTIDGQEQMWLFNPVSKFWYSLRYEKDRFSTLNQGTGVYCFDLWVREVRKRGIRIMLQYHDEIAFPLLKESRDEVSKILQDSIEAVNSLVKLNVPLGVSVDFGVNYAEIH